MGSAMCELGARGSGYFRVLMLLLTYECNWACPHCIAPSSSAAMSLETFNRALGRYLPQATQVGLSGREPCLHPEFLAMIDRLVAHPVRFSINSNGTVLEEPFLSRLWHTPVSLYVSLDSLSSCGGGIRRCDRGLETRLAELAETKEWDIRVISTVSRSTLEHLDLLVSWCSQHELMHYVQPLSLGRSSPLYEREALQLVPLANWHRSIDALARIDPDKAGIVTSWMRIFSFEERPPIPENCVQMNRFIIIDPSGLRLPCFVAFSRDDAGDYPGCFEPSCLFCWDQANLGNVALD